MQQNIPIETCHEQSSKRRSPLVLPVNPDKNKSNSPIQNMGKFGVREIQNYHPDQDQMSKVQMVGYGPVRKPGPLYKNSRYR